MEIKFRAIDVKTNQYVYGDIAHVKTMIRGEEISHPYIIDVRRVGGMFYITRRYKVNPESIEQLIGYNEAGSEVYETVFDYNP